MKCLKMKKPSAGTLGLNYNEIRNNPMNTVTQLNKSKPAPQYNSEQVACILAYLAATASSKPIDESATIGLKVLLKSMSDSLIAEA